MKAMRIGRTLPPAAAPIYFRDILSGIKGSFQGQKEVDRFARELREYFNVKHCFPVSSGKAALTIILRSLHKLHPERNEVIIPAYTCFSVPSSIVRAGLKVVVCDVTPDTLDFNFDQLRKILSNSQNTLAIIPTHLFGFPADVKKTRECIENFPEVVVIEDAAQAMGSKVMNRKLGTSGDMGFFSLGRGKAFSTVEGGIILTDSDLFAHALHEQIQLIRGYSGIDQIKLIVYSLILFVFMRPLLFWFPKALPFLKIGETHYETDFSIKKMSSIQAGLSRGWQRKLESFLQVRIRLSKHWVDRIGNLSHKNISLITGISSGKWNALIRFPVLVHNGIYKEKILLESRNQGLGIIQTYPKTIDDIPDLKTCNDDQEFSGARECVEKIITLPIHSFVSLKDLSKIEKLLD